MIPFNRTNVLTNMYQGHYKKVLCLCSAGCLRSPTAAVVLSQEPFNFNTRAAGLTVEYAIIPVEEGLLAWADEIVVMSDEQVIQVLDFVEKSDVFGSTFKPNIVNLKIPDIYGYRDEKLMKLIKDKYEELTYINT